MTRHSREASRAASRKLKITQSAVDASRPGDRDFYLWDTSLIGFALKVMPTGSKTFLLQYRSPMDKRNRRFTLGRAVDMTATRARKLAEAAREQLREGIDPQDAKTRRAGAWTVTQAADAWLAYLDQAGRAPHTMTLYRAHLRRFIRKVIGGRKVADLKLEDVERVLSRVPGGTQQNRVCTTLSALIQFAIRRGQASSNPVTLVDRRPEKRRQRYLTHAELGRLGQALEDAEAEGVTPVGLGAIWLLAFTGARKSEILGLRWDEVDRESQRLLKREHKTARVSKEQYKPIFLNEAALEVLDRAKTWRVVGNPYVFPAASFGRVQGASGHFAGVARIWKLVRAQAGLPDVRLHDLRHNYASVAVSSGETLHVTGKLLGHTQAATTSRYAHLLDDPLRQAAESVGGQIAAGMKNGKGISEKVTPIRKGETA